MIFDRSQYEEKSTISQKTLFRSKWLKTFIQNTYFNFWEAQNPLLLFVTFPSVTEGCIYHFFAITFANFILNLVLWHKFFDYIQKFVLKCST